MNNMEDNTEIGNTEPIVQMEVEAKQNPDETMTLPLEDDNRVHNPADIVDEIMGTEDNVVSKDVELQTDHVAFNNKDVDLHSHNYNDDKEEQVHPFVFVDVKCQSNDVNIQQEFPGEDATTNGVHGKLETGVSNADHPNQLKSGTPPERTTDATPKDNKNTAEGDTPNDGNSDTDTDSYSNEDRINEKESNAYLEVNKDAQSKLKLAAMNNEQALAPKFDVGSLADTKSSNQSFLSESHAGDGDESGTEEEQGSFMKELETFFKERSMEFKPPKFYGEGLNLLKLWRAVTRLGGYEQVTSCKLWRQVGESFKPPKTCTTVSWTFRCFYEKALLEYEKHEMHGGELSLPDASLTAPSSIGNQAVGSQGSGRARRDAAARAMQGWHSQRLLGNGEVGDPIIKDKNSISMMKREKQLKSIGLLKRKTPSPVEHAVKVARMKATKPQVDTMVIDAGPPADWVKINVRRTKDCFEVYALVPGLLREEVRVQSDPVGRLVISGEPENLDNPWGVTPFKKVVSLPSRIDPHQTSAVVTLHGQLFVRVPFEQSDL